MSQTQTTSAITEREDPEMFSDSRKTNKSETVSTFEWIYFDKLCRM